MALPIVIGRLEHLTHNQVNIYGYVVDYKIVKEVEKDVLNIF